MQTPGDLLSMKLDRPIFLVGHARGGSTALAAIINWHSQVGPKSDIMLRSGTVKEFVKAIMDAEFHLEYSCGLEQKDVWFDYFPGKDVFTHMGKELTVESWGLDALETGELIGRLTKNFHEQRFVCKAPTNSFRVRALREGFPGAKLLALYRSGPEVVASWGLRPYGFRQMGYWRGIEVFSRKWSETIEYIEKTRNDTSLISVCYDDLVERTGEALRRVLQYLDLPVQDYIYDIELADNRKKWKATIPWYYQWLVLARTSRGMRLYEQARQAFWKA